MTEAAARELKTLGGRSQSIRVLRWTPVGPAQFTNTLRVGTSASMSWHDVHWQESRVLQQAYELYFEMLSQEVDGFLFNGAPYAVELYIVDDLSSYLEAFVAYFAMWSWFDIRFFLGPASAEPTLAAAEVVDAFGAVMVASGSSDPTIFTDRRTVFGTLPGAQHYFAPALDALAASGARTLAYLHDDEIVTQPMCTNLPQLSRERGLTLLNSGLISSKSVRSVVRRLKEEDPDAVVGCLRAPACKLLLEEAREQDFNPKAIVFSLCTTIPEFLSDGTGQFSIGIMPQVPILPMTPTSRSLSQLEFTQKWQEQASSAEVPTFQAVAAFTSCAALVLAVKQTGSFDPLEVAAALANVSELSFDASGQSTVATTVVQSGGVGSPIRVVAPRERATHPLVYPRPRWRDLPCFSDSTYRHVGILTDGSTQAMACEECPPGKRSDFDARLGWRVCNECPPGQALAVQMKDGVRTYACFPCIPGLMNFRADGLGICLPCPAGKFQDQEGQTECHDCPAGTFSHSNGATTCISCHKYSSNSRGSFNTKNGSMDCYDCPVGGICEPDAQGLYSGVTNEDNYYMLPSSQSGGPSKLYRCPYGNGAACLARGRCYEDPLTGKAMMEGPMCGRCAQGFGRSAVYNLCEECEGPMMAVLGLAVNLLLQATVIMLVLLIAVNTDFTRPRQIHSVILRQWMNYVQMAVIVTERLGSGVKDIFDISKYFTVLKEFAGLSTFSSFALQCLTWGAAKGTDYYKVEQLLGLISVPIFMFSLCFVFEICSAFSSWRGMPVPSRRVLVTAIIITLFAILPVITNLNLASWNCGHYDVARLATDPAVKCLGQEHRAWLFIAGIGLIVFSLGIPLALYLLLLRFHSRLQEDNIAQMLGFLTCGFEDQFWYFECVFMVRKVLFQVVPEISNLTTDSQEKSVVTQNSTLAVLAGIFLSIHLHYQPYDNRCNFILDRIESASLQAILMTLVLQRWSWETDSTVLFASPGSRRLRDVSCVAIVLVLHGRAMLLMLWGLVRGMAPKSSDGHSKSKSARWKLVRFLRLFMADGRASIHRQGLDMYNVTGVSLQLFCSVIKDIVRVHVKQSSCLDFHGINDSMQRVVVAAHTARQIEAIQMRSPILYFFKSLRAKIRKLPFGREAAEAMADQLEAYLEKKGWMARYDGVQDDGRVTSVPTYRSTRFSRNSALSQVSFTKDAVAKTRGEVYAIEELHAALMWLGGSVFKEPDPIAEDPNDEEELKAITTDRRTTFAVVSPVTSDHACARDADDPNGLSKHQLLSSDLRALRQENARTEQMLEKRRKESQRLLRDVREAELKLERFQAVAQEHPSGGAQDTAAASDRVASPDRYTIATEGPLQAMLASTVRSGPARPNMKLRALSPVLRGPAAAEAPEREEAKGPHVLAMGGRQRGRAHSPGRVNSPPRTISPTRGRSPTASNTASSLTSSWATSAGLTRAVLPLRLVEPSRVVQPAELLERTADTAGGHRASNSQAPRASARSSRARKERRAEPRAERKVATSLAEELRRLTRERDSAREHAEEAALQLESARIAYDGQERELQAQRRHAREIEGRLVQLEMDSARLRAWVDSMPSTTARVDNFLGDMLHTLQGESGSLSRGEGPSAKPGQQRARSDYLASALNSPQGYKF